MARKKKRRNKIVEVRRDTRRRHRGMVERPEDRGKRGALRYRPSE